MYGVADKDGGNDGVGLNNPNTASEIGQVK